MSRGRKLVQFPTQHNIDLEENSDGIFSNNIPIIFKEPILRKVNLT